MKLKHVLFLLTIFLSLTACSLADFLPEPTPTPQPLTTNEYFYNGIRILCGFLPKEPVPDSQVAYSPETCELMTQAAISVNAADRAEDLIKRLPSQVEGQNATYFNAGMLYICENAPSDPGDQYVNRYSLLECQDLVGQAITADYYGSFQAEHP